MTAAETTTKPLGSLAELAGDVLNTLPHPVLVIGTDNRVTGANDAAQAFFLSSAATLSRQTFDQLLPFGSPLLDLIAQVRARQAAVSEYRIDIGGPKIGAEKVVDVYASTLSAPPGSVMLMLQERSRADKIARQMTHRGAARTVTGLAAMLAHEIKNPLSGIRGAAQLLEQSASDDDRALTRLICDETDRIVKLVDRMEVFSDERPVEREPVNIHTVLDHVKRLAQSGFARDIRVVEDYDPSLPPILANRDQLVQVFLNLLKNAAESLVGQSDAEIVISTAYRPGVRLSVTGSREKVTLPMEFCIRDNGPGVHNDLLPHLFDPFVTTKTNGSGLGLALVAKIIRDHGGVVECESVPRRTVFRVLMPAYQAMRTPRQGP